MYDKHVFVCTNTREDGRQSCGAAGAEIHAELKAAGKQLKIPKLRVNKAGCLGLCKFGPAMVVYPDKIWYAKVTKADVSEIAEKTLKEGQAVERLVYIGGPAEA